MHSFKESIADIKTADIKKHITLNRDGVYTIYQTSETNKQ